MIEILCPFASAAAIRRCCGQWKSVFEQVTTVRCTKDELFVARKRRAALCDNAIERVEKLG